MLFRNLMRICLAVMGIILILEGLEVIFHIGGGIITPLMFWFVVVFVLGIGVCRYCVDDVRSVPDELEEN